MRHRPRGPARLLVYLAVLGAARAGTAPDQILELQVKSAFLYNFAKFVDWPASAPNADGSFTFCVMGSDPLFPVLAQTLRGKTLNGRTLLARRIETASNARQCSVVFIGGSESKDLARIPVSELGAGVLTVGDLDHFVDSGGMIQLIKDDNRFRFAINVEAVNRSGLRMSSKLLQLAGTAPKGAGGKP